MKRHEQISGIEFGHGSRMLRVRWTRLWTAHLQPIIGLALVSIAAILWGTVGVANGLMNGRTYLDPVIVGAVRVAMGATLLLAVSICIRTNRPNLQELPIGWLLLFGLCGATFQYCLFEAFDHVGVTITVAVTVCMPPMIVALAEAVWHQRVPPRWTSIALALAVFGVVLVTITNDNTAPNTNRGTDLTGIALLAGASFAFSGISVSARAACNRMPSLCVAYLGLMATAAVLAGVGLLRSPDPFGAISTLPGRDLAILAYIGFVATGVAYLAFVVGMKLSSSAGTGLAATMIEPVFAAVLASILLRESLSMGEQLGCALMLAAMLTLFKAEVDAKSHVAVGNRAGTR